MLYYYIESSAVRNGDSDPLPALHEGVAVRHRPDQPRSNCRFARQPNSP
jgi:hypothetical protein